MILVTTIDILRLTEDLPNSKVWKKYFKQFFLPCQLGGHLLDTKFSGGFLFWRMVNIQAEATVEFCLNLSSIIQVECRIRRPSGLLLFRIVIILAIWTRILCSKICGDPGGTSNMNVD